MPGGGTKISDCIAEWAVINPFNSPFLGNDDLPSFKQSCVDGDPTCDADGAFDDRCTFRVALCLQNADPNLPTCAAPPGISKYVLVSPRPNSSEVGDAANALALMDSFGRLSSDRGDRQQQQHLRVRPAARARRARLTAPTRPSSWSSAAA